MKLRSFKLAFLVGCAAVMPASSLFAQMSGILDNITSIARRSASTEELHNAVKTAAAVVSNFTPAEKAEIKEKKIRYIAVPTNSSGEVKTSSSAGTDLILYDLLEGTTVNKDVYTVPDASKGKVINTDDGYETLVEGR